MPMRRRIRIRAAAHVEVTLPAAHYEALRARLQRLLEELTLDPR